MLVGEVLLRKRILDDKIKESELYLNRLLNDQVIDASKKSTLYSKTINRLFDLNTKLQSHEALLSKVNCETYVTLTDKEISVADAVFIKKTLMKKLNIITSVVSTNDLNIDLDTLISNRDAIFEEYIRLKRVIEISDWETNIE